MVLDKDTDDIYYFKQVTFEKKYRNTLTPYFTFAEQMIASKKINPSQMLTAPYYITNKPTEVSGFVQYFLYKHNVGEENDALTKIQSSTILIKCRDADKGGAFNIKSLYQYIIENRAKIIVD